MLELASLKFSVNTDQLKDAADKLDALAKKAGDLGKVTKELSVSEKNLAIAAKESAKAADLNASAELKLAQAREKDAQAAERNAKASKTVTEANIKQAESAAKVEVQQQRKVKAAGVETDAMGKLVKMYVDYTSKVEFVEQGNSRVEAGMLTLAKNLGATAGDLQNFNELFDRMRKMQKGDAFDGSTGALRKLKLELEVSQQLLKNFGSSGALTRSQMMDLGRALQQVEAEGKQFNLTQAQISTKQEQVRKEFIATAQSMNLIEAEYKQLRTAATQTADAHVQAYEKEKKARHQATLSFVNYRDKVIETKLATKELYSQGVFSRTTINQFVELERKAREAGVSIKQLNEIKAEMAALDLGNAGLKFQSDLIKGLTTQVLALGAAYVSIQGLVQAGGLFIKTADDMKLLKSRLDIAGEGTINFKRDFAALVKIANDARSPIESVTTVFTRLVPIMPAMGKGVKEATQVTEALTKMLRISGRGAQEASSAMLQFSQAMAKGKLDGDEFRSLAENLPEVLRVLEKQTGKTRAEIMLMSSAGLLTATMMTDAMIKSLGKLDEQLKKMPETVEGATTVLKNNFTLLVQKMDEASGISSKLAAGILKVAESVKAVSEAGPGMTGVLTAVTAFVGTSVITGLGALALKLGAVAGGYASIRLAVAGFAGFLAANPIGLAILGISAVAGVSGYLNAQKTQVKSIQDGTEKLRQAGMEYQSVTAKLAQDQATLNALPNNTQADKNKRSIYEDRIAFSKKQLQELGEVENALKKNMDSFKTDQSKTSDEKFFASLTEAERAAKSPTQYLLDSGYGKNSKDGLAKDWLKNNSEVQAGLSKAIKTAEFQYSKAVDEIKASGLSPKEQQQRLNEAFGNLTSAKSQLSSDSIKALGENQRKYNEALKSLDKKESGPVKQATSEGYGVKNDAVIENLKKRYDAEMKTIREGETAKRQILESSGATGAELFQKQYQIADEANKAESAKAREYFNEVNEQTKSLIAEANTNYEKFVKEQSGKSGFDEANKKMQESRDLFINKLKDGLETLNVQIRELEKRNDIDLFRRLTVDVNKAGSEITKLNSALTDLINKEEELRSERNASEEAQIASIGMTEKQIVMLKAETDERNRLNSQKSKLFSDIEREKNNLEGMIQKRDELSAATNICTKEEIDLNAAIDEQKAKLDALNVSMDTYNGYLMTLPQEQAARALRELNRKEVQEFSNKIADALMQGLSSGAKTGSRAIRKIIMDELKKPITITVQALVNTAVGALTGGGSNGVLGSVTNALGLGKNLSGAADFLGLGNIFGGSSVSSVGSSLVGGLGSITGTFGSMLTGATEGLSLLSATATSSAVPSLAAIGQASFGSAAAMTEAAGALSGATSGLSLGASTATGASMLGGLGSALAAAAPWLAGAALLIKGFSMGPRQVTGTGVTGTFGQGGFEGNLFETWKKKGGWFRSDKSGTDLKALDSGIDKGLDDSFTALKLNAIASAKALGLTTDSIVNFSKTVRIEFGSNAEENNKKMQEMLDGMSNDIARILIPSIDSLAVAGEQVKDTFARLATNMTSVNSIVGLLGVKLIDVSVVGAQAATALADMFGGIDKLRESTNVYYDAFYSQDEKMTLSLKVMTDAMKAVGLTLPSTKEEFRKMVDVLDLNTEYGRNLYSTMVKIAPVFNEFTTAIEEVKTKVTEAASTLRDSIFEARYGTMTSETQLSTLKEQFDSLVAGAALQSGEELAGTSEKISSSLQPLLDKVKEVYASGPEYFRLQEEILSKAGMIANRSDNLGTYEDRSLASLSDISSILSKINESGQLTVVNLQKLIGYGNTTNPVTSGTASGYAQATIVKANSEAAAILEKISAQSKVTSFQSSIAGANSEISSLMNSLVGIKTNAVMSTDFAANYSADPSVMLNGKNGPYQNKFAGNLDYAYDYISKYIIYSDPAKPVMDSIVALQNNIAELNNQIQYQQSIAGDISSQDTETRLAALRKQITDAGGVPAFAKGAAFSGGVVKEPTLFNMGMMGEAGAEGILPLAKTSSGALGVQSVGVGSQEVSERLVESNKHLGALVRLQQASNLKIIEKLSEVEQRLEGIETAARLEANA